MVPEAKVQQSEMMRGGETREQGSSAASALQSEMGTQPRSISERYKGSGKLKDKARARARALRRRSQKPRRTDHDATTNPLAAGSHHYWR